MTPFPGKQRILRAALQLFTEKGLCETSIRDIGAVAGLSNPALYKLYKSKEALAQELFVFCYRWLHSALERVVGGEFETFAAQIVVTLAMVGWLSRNPIPTTVAPTGDRLVPAKSLR